jgi:membrane protease subunit (stomatin/prohibitin family)
MPILSTLKGWKYGFDSPFKAEVYFVNTRVFTDMKWGTQNPVIVRDAEFGMARLRAFGAYAARVTDARKLLTNLVGTDPQFRTEEVEELPAAEHRRPARQRARDRGGTHPRPRRPSGGARRPPGTSAHTADLSEIGIEIAKFIIENISLPPEVEAAIDSRAKLGVPGRP